MGIQIEDWVRWTMEVPLFRGLTEEELKRFLSAAKIREYASGQKLIEEGQPSREFFILLSGEVRVEVAGALLARIKPVWPVGEMGVVTGQVRSADVIVMRPSKVLVMEKRDFDRIIWEDCALGIKVYRNLVVVLSERIRTMDERFREFAEETKGWEESWRPFV